MKKQNQQNPPLPKERRVDSKGNDHRRFAAKDGGTTMTLVTGLTENGCITLEETIKEAINKLGGKLSKNIKFVNFR